MAVFSIERSLDGERWTTMYASPFPVGPGDLHGPQGEFPVNDRRSAFAGFPGSKVRVSYDGLPIENYVWDKVKLNPSDGDSELVWGWKLLERNHYPQEATANLLPLGVQ